MQLDHDQPPLLARPEEVEVDARRDHPVVAGESLARGGRRLLGGGDEGVDPSEQLVAQRPRAADR